MAGFRWIHPPQAFGPCGRDARAPGKGAPPGEAPGRAVRTHRPNVVSSRGGDYATAVGIRRRGQLLRRAAEFRGGRDRNRPPPRHVEWLRTSTPPAGPSIPRLATNGCRRGARGGGGRSRRNIYNFVDIRHPCVHRSSLNAVRRYGAGRKSTIQSGIYGASDSLVVEWASCAGLIVLYRMRHFVRIR